MALRSNLFVSGDSEKTIARSADAGADALEFDLARSLVSQLLAARSGAESLWVRSNPFDSGDMAPDLDLIVSARAEVEAFDADPELGTIQLDSRMIDIPHPKPARRILAQAAGE